MSCGNSDAPQNSDAKHPSSPSELGCRLAAVAKSVGSQSRAADLMGVSLSQFKRYVAGDNQPTFETVANLSLSANLNLDWLAFGRGEMRAGEAVPTPAPATTTAERDADLVGRVLEAISVVYKELGWRKSLHQLGEEAAQIADRLAAEGITPEDKPGAVKATAADLRHRLRQSIADPKGDIAGGQKA
jgi:transcriptional regulator with XRE-family HTH domain